MIVCFYRTAKEKLNAIPQPAAQLYHAPEPPSAFPLPGTIPVPVTPVTPVTPSGSHQLTPQQFNFGLLLQAIAVNLHHKWKV